MTKKNHPKFHKSPATSCWSRVYSTVIMNRSGDYSWFIGPIHKTLARANSTIACKCNLKADPQIWNRNEMQNWLGSVVQFAIRPAAQVIPSRSNEDNVLLPTNRHEKLDFFYRLFLHKRQSLRRRCLLLSEGGTSVGECYNVLERV